LAINREKELKKRNRQKKDALINNKNPEWIELVTEKGFIREKQTDSSLHCVALGMTGIFGLVEGEAGAAAKPHSRQANP
jgi:hypothetical protein